MRSFLSHWALIRRHSLSGVVLCSLQVLSLKAKRKKFDPDVILEKKNVIVAEVVAQAKELEKTLEEKMNLLDACHAVRKDLKTAHSSLQEQIIELERKLSGLRN